MSHTLTIRLSQDLADWLDEQARKTGTSRGRIVREQLERAKARSGQRFMRLAGATSGPRRLSERKGFARG